MMSGQTVNSNASSGGIFTMSPAFRTRVADLPLTR
jgi:hypothetical protein